MWYVYHTGIFYWLILKISKIGKVFSAKQPYLCPRKSVTQYEKHYLQRLHSAHQ